MTITKIQYGRTYPTGNFSSERIDCEMTLDAEDDVQEAFQLLKVQCDTINKKNNPHLYQEQTPIVPDINEHPAFILDHLPEPDEKITPEDTKRYIIGEIDKCKTIKELKQWDLLSRRYDDASIAYTQKEKELL